MNNRSIRACIGLVGFVACAACSSGGGSKPDGGAGATGIGGSSSGVGGGHGGSAGGTTGGGGGRGGVTGGGGIPGGTAGTTGIGGAAGGVAAGGGRGGSAGSTAGGGGGAVGGGGRGGAVAGGGGASGGTAGSPGGGGGARGGAGGAPAGTAGAGGAVAGMGGATGQAIVATAGQWTWIPFPDAFCADGSTTGIGINPNQATSRLLFYFEGGGACWSEMTCYTLMTAANFTTGYSQAQFALESTAATYLAEPGGLFDRTAAANPFKDYSYVYVPYCTGDLHAGNNTATYGTHTAKHVGAVNVAAYLKRLVPTFQAADRVYIAGSSAGGYGALLNWWQTQQAFGSTRVDMIDDSGTPMPPDILSLGNGAEALQRTAWNLASTLPPGCTACATRLDAIFAYYAGVYPTHRAALLSYTMDSVLPADFGITTAQFTTGLNEELTTYFTPTTNFKSFIVNDAKHVLWFAQSPAQQFQQLEQFLGQMVTDNAAWASVGP